LIKYGRAPGRSGDDFTSAATSTKLIHLDDANDVTVVLRNSRAERVTAVWAVEWNGPAGDDALTLKVNLCADLKAALAKVVSNS